MRIDLITKTACFILLISICGVSCKRASKDQIHDSDEVQIKESKPVRVKVPKKNEVEPFSIRSFMKESLATEMKYQDSPNISKCYLNSTMENKDNVVILKVWVKDETPVPFCKSIASKFVRMVKGFSNDITGDILIGAGKYRYEVTVFDEQKKVLLKGHKNPSEKNITYTTK
ncbi:MAG: hypothetical protein ACJAR1_002156 [Rubritalea sp.]|jgi:hypothetical protein